MPAGCGTRWFLPALIAVASTATGRSAFASQTHSCAHFFRNNSQGYEADARVTLAAAGVSVGELSEAQRSAVARHSTQPKPPPRSGLEIENRARQAWRGGFVLLAQLLRDVHNELLYLFPGREKEVNQLMSALKTAALLPGLVKKPIVINLFSDAGEGKTMLLRKAIKLLGLESRSHIRTLADDAIRIEDEVFDGLADVTEDSPHPRLALLGVDEWQKLMPHDALSTAALNLRVSEDGLPYHTTKDEFRINQVEQRARFVNTLYRIYGNGEQSVAPRRNFWNAVKELKNVAGTCSEDRENLRKHLLTVGEPQTAAQLQQTDYLNAAAERSRTVLAREWREFVRDFRPIIPDTFVDSPSNDVIEQFIRSPNMIPLSIRPTIDDPSNIQRERRHLQMVTVIMGNPESMLRAQRRARAGRTQTFAGVQSDWANADLERMRQEMFDRVFGEAGVGLRQRLGVDHWGLMRPLSHNDWQRFVRAQLTEFEREFLFALEQKAITGVDFRIDASVEALLMNEAVSPTDSPRAYFENQIQLVGEYFTDLALRMIESPDAARPTHLAWVFDANRREHVAIGRASDGSVVFEERAPVRLLTREPAGPALDPDQRDRLLISQACQVVQGMALIGALPAPFRFDPTPNGWEAQELWAAPDRPRFGTLANFVRIAMAGSVGHSLASDGLVPLSSPMLKFAHESVGRMYEVLRQRERDFHYLVRSGPNGERIYDALFPRPLDIPPPVFQALAEASAAGADDSRTLEALNRAIHLFHQDVMTTLQSNSELVSSIARLMDRRDREFRAGQRENPDISPSDMLTVVADYERQFAASGGFLRRASVSPQIITLSRVQGEPGVVSVSRPTLLQERTAVRLGWFGRLRAWWRGSRAVQRSFGP